MSNYRLYNVIFTQAIDKNKTPYIVETQYYNVEKVIYYNVYEENENNRARLVMAINLIQKIRAILLNFLESQIKRVPTIEVKHHQLKELYENVLVEYESTTEIQAKADKINDKVLLESIPVEELIEKVQKTKELVSQHRDTGFWGFIKCTFFRCTRGLNEFNKVFDEKNRPRVFSEVFDKNNLPLVLNKKQQVIEAYDNESKKTQQSCLA